LSTAVITGEVFAVVVFMSVLTTIVAPPLLTWAYKDLIVAGRGTEGIRIG